jgi:spermidine/putrescine transport system substrate-binding protein
VAAPIDPKQTALRRAMSRRTLLQATGLGAAGLAVAACGGAGGGGSDNGDGGGGGGDALSFSNWLGYLDLDEESGESPSLVAFQEASGITVKYTEDINDNEEFYAKVRPQLEQGESIGRDLVVLTDWMAARWIRLGYTESFTEGAIPNKANLLPALANVAFDPSRESTLPWQSGFAGLGWNVPLLKEALGTDSLTSLEQLWDPKLKGRVSVLSEMRDTIGVILLAQGKNPADFTADDFEAANAELAKQIDSGQIRQVSGNDYLGALENGDVIAVIGWSGDVIALGDDFGFALPESGGTLWTDNAMIPKGAARKADAEKLLDYYYDPANAALVAAYVNYLCPVQGVQAEMEKIAPELADSPWIFPSSETLDQAAVFKTLTDAEEAAYNEAFQKTIGN